MVLIFDGMEMNVSFDLTANDMFDSRDIDITFETYGPLFRDDFDNRTAADIDAVILKNLEDGGELDTILDEMEVDSLEEGYKQKAYGGKYA
tara:strand:- start:1618 stop:1890 length:273 start_codon:yes stop_codon:yes gene_type:complete